MKKLLALVLALLLLLSFAACKDTTDDKKPDTDDKQSDVNNDNAEVGFTPVEIKIASLKGPTTMGMVKMMDDCENGLTEGIYSVEIFGTADEIVPKIVKGEIDAANVPCNLASVLYKKTEGQIAVVNINTLGVLYVVETGDTIKSVEDLRGKTIYSTGKGTTPEYVLNHILKINGLDPEKDVTVEFKSEATEVAAMLEGADNAVAVLPQPYVTVASTKNDKIRIALDLTKEWASKEGTQLVTGVTIVRKEFIEEHPEAVAKLLEECAKSVEFVNANVESAAALVGKYDIVAEGVAKKALPYCNIVSLTGENMKASVEAYLSVLFESDPTAIGGQLPDEDFYYFAD